MVGSASDDCAGGDASLLERALTVAESVADPELPFLTIKDLGILRNIAMRDGIVIAEVSPTYSGCPAVTVIEQAVETALQSAGIKAKVQRVLSPPWSTDLITEEGRKKLHANGISPPERSSDSAQRGTTVFFSERNVACPFCASEHTEKVSEFGSTPCKAQYRCCSCLEPFDHFKCH